MQGDIRLVLEAGGKVRREKVSVGERGVEVEAGGYYTNWIRNKRRKTKQKTIKDRYLGYLHIRDK